MKIYYIIHQCTIALIKNFEWKSNRKNKKELEKFYDNNAFNGNNFNSNLINFFK